MKLVASRHSAPAVANSNVQPIGTRPTASSAYAPASREMSELRDRRDHDQGRAPRDQHREHQRHQDLCGEQSGREDHADDHQQRSEHAAGSA